MFLANLRVTIMQEVDHSGFNCMASNKVIESMICDDCVQGVIKKCQQSKNYFARQFIKRVSS